jgi:long-chain acyl-CoA synthetase
VQSNLSTLLEGSALKRPSKTALVFKDLEYTYEALNCRANQLAGGLRGIGLKRGDRVALRIHNIPEFLICHFAALKIASTVVPTNVMLKERELTHIVRDSETAALIVSYPLLQEALSVRDSCASLRELIVIGEAETAGTSSLSRLTENQNKDFVTEEVSRKDVAVILYTSGTTGKPKGAMLTHANLLSNAIAMAEACACSAQDVGVSALPLFHSYALTNVVGALFSQGGTLILHERFVPEDILQSFADYDATVFYGVPTMYIQLLNHPNIHECRENHLRFCMCGGASLPVEVLREFDSLMGVEISEGYGLTEASPVVTQNPLHGVRKPGSVGIPISDDIVVKIFDERDDELSTEGIGEIVVRGPNVMAGYINQPEASRETLRGGWLHTGDVGYKDEDGYVFVVDRKKDMIVRSGYNIYPREIEEVLYEHPNIAEAAVIGIPDDTKGEEVIACIALKPGEEVTEENVISFCRERMAAYKLPKFVCFEGSLPKSQTGKVLKTELRKRHLENT